MAFGKYNNNNNNKSNSNPSDSGGGKGKEDAGGAASAPEFKDASLPQFLNALLSLGEPPRGTVRFFDRRDYVSAHLSDARLVARDYYKTLACLKYHTAADGTRLPYVTLSHKLFGTVVSDLLLRRNMRVEFLRHDSSASAMSAYAAATSSTVDGDGGSGGAGSGAASSWLGPGVKIVKRGSPGNLDQFEDVLVKPGGSAESGDAGEVAAEGFQPVLAAAKVSTGNQVAVAYVRSSTRELATCEFVDDDGLGCLESLLVQVGATECLIPMSTAAGAGDARRLQKAVERSGAVWTERRAVEFSDKSAEQDLTRLVGSTAGAVAELEKRRAVSCLAAVVRYLDLLSDASSLGRFRVVPLSPAEFMRIDAAAVSALSLFPQQGAAGGGGTGYNTLYGVLNRCKTAPGSRLLLRWVKAPLLDATAIEARQDIVELVSEDTDVRLALQEDLLPRLPDLPKLVKKVDRGRATLQDVVRIYQCVARVPDIVAALESHQGPHAALLASSFVAPLRRAIDDCANLLSMVEHTIDLTRIDNHEYLISPSFNEELQDIAQRKDGVLDDIADEHAVACGRLGVDEKKCKVERNEVLGYYLRLPRKDANMVDKRSGFETLETRKDGVRFTTSKLKRLSEEHTDLNRRYAAKQSALVSQALDIVATYGPVLEDLAAVLARLDALVAMAAAGLSAPTPFVRPQLTEAGSGSYVLRAARHPCIERQEGVRFIPNDLELRRDGERFLVVTGPNMGGKSSYIRTAGIVTIMAHIGCFVPADSAEIPVTDKVLCRIGAGDSTARGLSTFMQEMLEMGAMLRAATPRSLLVIDELGRGTSTYDGFGLAWAISKHVADTVRAPCLFATHFHELTSLASESAAVGNCHVSAHVTDDELTLLYAVKPGPSDQSFGIHVAKMARFPEEVVVAAKRKAAELEAYLVEDGGGPSAPGGAAAAAGDVAARMAKRAKTFQGEDDVRRDGERFMQEIIQTQGTLGADPVNLKRRVQQCDNAYIRHLLAEGE